MTKPTGPRHEKPPALRLLRPDRPYTLDKAPHTTDYTRLLESIWALLSYNKEPYWVYMASEWCAHVEHRGSPVLLMDRWDKAIKEATKLNLEEMKGPEALSDRTGITPRINPLVDCAVAWHIATCYTLAPWLLDARQHNIFDRTDTALGYVKAVLPVLTEYPAITTEMAERLAAHYGARIFS